MLINSTAPFGNTLDDVEIRESYEFRLSKVIFFSSEIDGYIQPELSVNEANLIALILQEVVRLLHSNIEGVLEAQEEIHGPYRPLLTPCLWPKVLRNLAVPRRNIACTWSNCLITFHKIYFRKILNTMWVFVLL